MFTFRTSVTWKPETEGLDLASAGKPLLAITSPPEFGGKPDHWSPEEMLVGAVESCLLLTALHFVGRSKIQLKTYRSEATGSMQKSPSGLRFTGINILITACVGSAEEVPKLQQAMNQAEKFCPVSAAIAAPITVTLQTTIG